MTLLDKLDRLMEKRGLNKHTLSHQSGVPYTTIVGLYERGYEHVRLSTLNKLCSFFNVPLDYLAFDKYENPSDFVPNGLVASIVCESADEEALVVTFRSLNESGRSLVLMTAKTCAGNPDMQKDAQSASVG